MKKKHSAIFFLLICIHVISVAQETNIVPGNLLVMVNSENDAQQLSTNLQYLNGVKTDLKIERILSKSMHIYLYDFNTAINDVQLLNVVKINPLVKIAQFNHIFKERTVPNDSLFSSMWDMNNTGMSGGTVDADIDAPEAWDITTGGLTSEGDSIVVAVVDGGFDLMQPDLNFWKNYQEIPGNGIDDDGNGFIDDYRGWNGADTNDVIPSASHGTHVAGTVGARGNNHIGVTGVNWNVKIMAVSYGSGGSFESNVVASYAYAMDQRRLYNQTGGAKGAFVVSTNSSFGIDHQMPSAHPLWCAMYDSLGAVGILSAGATTNTDTDVDIYGDIPTACTSNWLITVTNTTRTDDKNSSCGYGATTIDLGAPGTQITSTYPAGTYASITGTSMATPHVAGTVALMYSVACSPFIAKYKANPAAIALIVKDSLLGAVDPIASMSGGITVTGGRLNLYKSVKSMQNYCIALPVNENDPINNNFIIEGVYPNPVSNILNVVYNSYDAVEISITNLLGQEIKRVKSNTGKGIQHEHIDISSIDKGVYFISMYNGNRKSNVVKVIMY